MVGRFGWANIQARPADQVGDAERGPDRRHERADPGQGHEERGAGAEVHRLLAVPRRSQTRLAMDLVDGPANKSVEVPAETAGALTYGAETAANLSFITPAAVLENREAWVAGLERQGRAVGACSRSEASAWP